MEHDVGCTDGDPGEKPGNGGEILEPGEYRGGACRGGHVCQACDCAGDANAPVWNTGLGAVKQETWSLSVLCQSEEIARSRVEESVGGRRSRRQDNGVDNGGEDWDLSALDGNDPWRSRGARRAVLDGRQEVGIVVWHKNTDSQRTEDVEEQDTPEDTTNSLGDVSTGVLGLACCDCHHFDASVREGCVD